MQVQVFEQVPECLADQVAELLSDCFRVDNWTALQREEHHDRFCSQGDTWRHLLAVNADTVVVGFATVYRRSIVWNGTAIVLGGLGDVCTAQAFRRQGIASAITAEGMHEMGTAGCDMAYLCAAVDDPAIVRLYGQFGFVPLRRPHTYLGRSGRLYEDMDAMVAPVGSHHVFDAVVRATEPFHIGTGNW